MEGYVFSSVKDLLLELNIKGPTAEFFASLERVSFVLA